METIYTQIATAVTPTTLMGQVAAGAVLIGSMILFAFGYCSLKKIAKGASKGKVNF